MLNLTLLTLPPQNAIDDPIEWISQTDPAWDNDRIEAERKLLADAAGPVLLIKRGPDAADEAKARREQGGHCAIVSGESPMTDKDNAAVQAVRAEARLEAGRAHPVSVWYTGDSRYSHDAMITVPEALRTKDRPAAAVAIGEYLSGAPTIFELRSLDARGYRAAMAKVGKGDGGDAALVRRGLMRITGVDDEGTVIKPDLGPDGLIAWDWIDRLDRQDRSLIGPLGMAVYNASAGESERGKR